MDVFMDADQAVLDYVSRLWAEDWDCPEDAAYDFFDYSEEANNTNGTVR
jgi:hypothetical protein